MAQRRVGEFCSEAGATELKWRIIEHWTKLGKAKYLVVEIVAGPFTPAMRSASYYVRSNMLNGMPPNKPTPVRDPTKNKPVLRSKRVREYA